MTDSSTAAASAIRSDSTASSANQMRKFASKLTPSKELQKQLVMFIRDLESDPLMKEKVLHHADIDAYGPDYLLGPLNIVGGSLQLYRRHASLFEDNDQILPTVTLEAGR
jgi:hypothetical protein